MKSRSWRARAVSSERGAGIEVRSLVDESRQVKGGSAGRIPNVPLRTQDGRSVYFYDDLVKGKCVLVNFMYTNCDGICPGQTAVLAQLQDALGDRMGREIFFYSITLDPARDSPEALAMYARDHGAKPGWYFLTGELENIELVRRGLGFINPDPEKDRVRSEHIGVVVIGNEALSRWAACPALSDIPVLVELIGWILGTREGEVDGAGHRARRAPSCPVDRSRGVIPVTLEGRIFYVCSDECRKALESNPAGVLADRAR